MKLHFCYKAWQYADGSRSSTLSPSVTIVSGNKPIKNKSFLLGFLQDCTSLLWIAQIEKKIIELELGRIDSFSDSSEGHFLDVSNNEVTVGRQISDRWTDIDQAHWQEMWKLSEFKAILLAWKKFLEMPADYKNEVVVEVLTE